MREYEFQYDGPENGIPGGRVALIVNNRGSVEHSLTLIIVPANMPGTIEDRARTPGPAEVFLNVFELRARNPGERGVFAVDLNPGRYAMVCLLEDANGQIHARKGMVSEFRVR